MQHPTVVNRNQVIGAGKRKEPEKNEFFRRLSIDQPLLAFSLWPLRPANNTKVTEVSRPPTRSLPARV